MVESSVFIELLRKMGHDMRVPLNTMISTSDMLLDGMYDPLTPKQARAVERMQRSSLRLLAIVDDFVIYVKANAGEMEYLSRPFSPRAQLEEWCGQVRPTIEANGMTLCLTTSEAVPPTLSTDESLVSRMVLALLWNAASYAAQGEIRVLSDWTPDEQWLISVQDSGPGIQDADLPHLFEPFWRGDQRPQVPTAGAGLGLPMSLALARTMGGDLFLKETGPTGSTFCIQLPAAPPG